MSEKEQAAREAVIAAGKKLLASGLIARTWGNVSARLSEEEFLITPSGRAYEDLQPEDLVVCRVADGQVADSGSPSVNGKVADAGNPPATGKRATAGKPSSEKGVHAAVYRQHPEAAFVIHTHQDYATSLSTLGRGFVPDWEDGDAAAILGPQVATAAYGLSGTKKLTKNVESCLAANPGSRCLLMQGHGAVCFGQDAEEAFRVAETLEQVAAHQYRRLTGRLFPVEAEATVGTAGAIAAGTSPNATAEIGSAGTWHRILRREIHEEYDRHYLLFEKGKIGGIVESAHPFIRKMSETGRPLTVYVDDLAQIAGLHIPCLPADVAEKKLVAALKNGGAVLIRGKGAVCASGTLDDALALEQVLVKGCMAALLARAGQKPIPVKAVSGNLEHLVYQKKYSKLKAGSHAEKTDA
ncbi:MAG: class II aldolase/adducin family protein [Firmicutes bacterium]|nr:class II aldolase/adducin family protein [Bacillota bacterium]